MSNEKLGQEPAFPANKEIWDGMELQKREHERGMSKRFYAACAAMQGILSNSSFMVSLSKIHPNKEDVSKMQAHLACSAYEYADKLLEQEN